MKVWRNSEGQEFPLWDRSQQYRDGASVNGRYVEYLDMRSLGYELVEVPEAEPEEFEVVAATTTPYGSSLDEPSIVDDRLIPGKTYVVRLKEVE